MTKTVVKIQTLFEVYRNSCVSKHHVIALYCHVGLTCVGMFIPCQITSTIDYKVTHSKFLICYFSCVFEVINQFVPSGYSFNSSMGLIMILGS